MPEWAMQLLITGGGLGLTAAGLKGWWNAWREDRKRRADALAADKEKEERRRQEEVDRLRGQLKEAAERIEKLQERFESLLVDAAAKAQDDKREKADLIAMLAKFHELSLAMVEALKDSTKARAKDTA